MGRPRSEYWNHVTKLGDKYAWKCNHCGHEYAGGAFRIEGHLKGIKGRGIEACKGSINPHPQEAANQMNPIEVDEGDHAMVDANVGGSMDHQTNPHESINLLRGSNDGFRSEINQLNELMDDLTRQINQLKELMDDLTREKDDIKGQLEWLECRGKKRKSRVDVWLDKVKDLKDKTDPVINSLSPFGLTAAGYDYLASVHLEDDPGKIQKLTEEVRKRKAEKPLVLSNELVGEGFEENVKKMWELLRDDQVFVIGIHGMGGVGKTCLAAHMENEMKRKKTFKHVVWVTVSRDFSIFRLQQDIVERIGVKLNGEDERTRAANLSSALMETKEKSVLILDDVWKYIDLEKVGIPLRVSGIKLILTSRLEHVSQQMDCLPNNTIRMSPLSREEGWELFLLKLGQYGTPAKLPPKVIKIAKSVAWKCAGLPLGISVMARTMKGVNDIHRWRHELKKLEKLEMGEEMEEEVLKVLKLSYDNLKDKCAQNCFLHCALYPSFGDRDRFVMSLFDHGKISGRRSLEETFDEGRTILDKFKCHSLLKLSGLWFSMNGLLRNMAYHIMMKESHKYMIKYGEGLEEIPHMQEWTSELEVVSLDSNFIEEIEEGTSPYCPRLSTLILSSTGINSIPQCFLTHMNALAILDLSGNAQLTSLPDSLSNLTSLISLVLRGCDDLKYVPSLERLQALSRLDISRTSIEEVRGLEMLINLKWLDLSFTSLSLISGLHGLTNLQYLDLRCAGSAKVKVGDNIQWMPMLECFGGSFHDSQSYNNYMKEISWRSYKPRYYQLFLGIEDDEDFEAYGVYVIVPIDECRVVVFGDCGEEYPHLLPKDLAELSIYENTHWRCLCDALLSDGSCSLRRINITGCEMQSMFCLSNKCSLCTNLQNLESLHLYDLKSLTVICKEDVAERSRALSPNGVFRHLRHLYISDSFGIETLLTGGSLSQLQNLETMTVCWCLSVREIFAVSSSDGDDRGSTNITLPKLTELKLIYLPQLKTVFKGIIICESLPTVKIQGCDKLERGPQIQVSS